MTINAEFLHRLTTGTPKDAWRVIIAHPAFAAAAAGFQLQVTKSAALTLTHRCEQSGQPACLNETVELWRSAVALSRDDPVDQRAQRVPQRR